MGFSSCLWPIYIPMLLLALWVKTLATQEYDDDNSDDFVSTTNSKDYSDETNTSDGLSCLQPRSFKGELNDTFLHISASTQDHLKSSITVVLIPSIYTIIFIVGLPANGLALWVLATKVKKMTSTVFFMNLAVADLLLILVLPFKIFYYYLGNNWIFGELMCRTVTSFFYGNMYCSALLLMSISIDRYLAVVHPFFSRTFRSTIFATGMCSVCWLIAVLSTIPLATMQQSYRLLDSDLILCHDALPEQEQATYLFYYFMSVIVLCFILPLVIILFSYIAVIRELIISGEKYTYAVKLSVLVLFIVIVFLTPSNVVLMMHYSEHCFERQNDLYAVYMVCLTVSTLNSCVDPFVYYYASEEFRGKVKNQFRKKSAISITSVKTSRETLPPSYSNCRSRSVL